MLTHANPISFDHSVIRRICAFSFSGASHSVISILGMTRKEKDPDYKHGYSTTKVATKDIAWLRRGDSPVGRLGQVGPTYGFVVLGYCTKANITNSAELRNIMIKLSKLVSDHGETPLAIPSPGRRCASISSDWKTEFMLLANAAKEAPLLLSVRPLRYQDRAESFLIAEWGMSGHNQ